MDHILQRILNRPLLVDHRKAAVILQLLGARMGEPLGRLHNAEDSIEAWQHRPRGSILGRSVEARASRWGGDLYELRDGVAVIEVLGSLVHRGGWIGPSSGITSYEGLRAQVRAAAADSHVRAIALEIDSYGGEVAGAFDLADAIREVRGTKPVWAFVGEHAYSGGYAIASQADRIILPRTGGVGSIGVLVMHTDVSDALRDEGVRVTLITAGAHKADGNPYAALSESVRASIQAEIEDLRGLFARTVAAGRGSRLTAEAALATEAAVYRGAAAVEAGLADEVADLESAFAGLVDEVRRGSVGIRRAAGKRETTMEMHEAAPERVEALEAEPVDGAAVTDEQAAEPVEGPREEAAAPEAAAPAPAADDQREALRQEVRQQAVEISRIAAQAGRLGVTVDLAAELGAGTSPETLRRRVLEEAAARADGMDVRAHNTAAAPGRSGEGSLAAAMEKRLQETRGLRN